MISNILVLPMDALPLRGDSAQWLTSRRFVPLLWAGAMTWCTKIWKAGGVGRCARFAISYRCRKRARTRLLMPSTAQHTLSSCTTLHTNRLRSLLRDNIDGHLPLPCVRARDVRWAQGQLRCKICERPDAML